MLNAEHNSLPMNLKKNISCICCKTKTVTRSTSMRFNSVDKSLTITFSIDGYKSKSNV